MKKRLLGVIIIFNLFVGFLQGSPWSLSLSTGVIQNTQTYYDDVSQVAIFPELQIERIIHSNQTHPDRWLTGSIYISHSNDLVNEPIEEVTGYHRTYSHLFYTVGSRFFLNIDFFNIVHAGLFGGVSYNYVFYKYVGMNLPDPCDCFRNFDNLVTKIIFNYGLNLDYPINNKLSLGIGTVWEHSQVAFCDVNPRFGGKIFLRYTL